MAGSLYLRFTTGAVQEPSQNQWAPDLASHDPNPPLSIESVPVAQYDWPNPRGREYPLELRTFVQPTITSRVVVVVRAPFVVPYWPRSWAVAIASQGAQNMPSAPAAAPFATLDWANPSVLRWPTELRTWIAAPQQQADVPAALLDWPLPRSRAAMPVWEAPNLLETTLAPAPFGQSDWPNPAARAQAQPSSAPNLLESTLASPAQVPFSQGDWPNPERRAARELLGWTQNLIETTLAPSGAVVFPRAPASSNAVRRDGSVALHAQAWMSFAPPAAPVAMPFSQSDWPNPRQPVPAIALRTFVGRVIAGPAVTPLRPVEWPNPVVRSALRQDVAPNLLETTLASAPASPVVPIDWPLPGRARHPIALLTWTVAPFAAQGAAPVSGFDWPTPAARRTPDQYGTWTQNLLQGTLSLPVQDPVRPPEMPLPGRAEYPISLRTWSVNLLEGTLALPVGVPLRPVDMPNPRGAPFPVTERGFMNWAYPDNVPPATAAATDWLVRARHRGGR